MRAYFLRHGDFVAKWQKYHVAAGNGNFAGQTRPFGRNRFFDYLHQNVVAGGQHIFYIAFAFEVRITFEFVGQMFAVAQHLFDVVVHRQELVAQIVIVNKRLFARTDVHKCGIQPLHHAFDAPKVNVAHSKRSLQRVFVYFDQFLVFQQGYGDGIVVNAYY